MENWKVDDKVRLRLNDITTFHNENRDTNFPNSRYSNGSENLFKDLVMKFAY